jgi:quinol monooxygenase YgiN
MAVRHVVTIRVTAGGAASFASAFEALRTASRQEEGCEQYELFQSLEDPDTLVILERWASQELLDKHLAAARTADPTVIEPIVALWAPGTTPTIERFEI